MDPTFESVETYTTEQFLGWLRRREGLGEPGRRELLHGRIVVTPPAAWPHGEIESILGTALRNHVSARGLGRVFGSSQGFRFPSGDIVEPDVSFVSAARWNASPRSEEQFPEIAPDLIMEILSPSTASRDRGEKRGIYERHGVSEYWLVDARLRRINVLTLENGRFRDACTADADGEATSSLLPGLAVRVRDLFG